MVRVRREVRTGPVSNCVRGVKRIDHLAMKRSMSSLSALVLVLSCGAWTAMAEGVPERSSWNPAGATEFSDVREELSARILKRLITGQLRIGKRQG